MTVKKKVRIPTMTKNYRFIAIRRFCSRIACGRLSLLYAQAVCSSGK